MPRCRLARCRSSVVSDATNASMMSVQNARLYPACFRSNHGKVHTHWRTDAALFSRTKAKPRSVASARELGRLPQPYFLYGEDSRPTPSGAQQERCGAHDLASHKLGQPPPVTSSQRSTKPGQARCTTLWSTVSSGRRRS